MYGLAYCKLDYEIMMDMDLTVLGIIFKAEMDRQLYDYDLEMQKLAWQTAYLMNASGNYKSAVKPEKLYKSIIKKSSNETINVEAKKEELLKAFSIKN